MWVMSVYAANGSVVQQSRWYQPPGTDEGLRIARRQPL